MSALSRLEAARVHAVQQARYRQDPDLMGAVDRVTVTTGGTMFRASLYSDEMADGASAGSVYFRPDHTSWHWIDHNGYQWHWDGLSWSMTTRDGAIPTGAGLTQTTAQLQPSGLYWYTATVHGRLFGWQNATVYEYRRPYPHYVRQGQPDVPKWHFSTATQDFTPRTL